MNDKITIEEDGRSITIEDGETPSHVHVVDFTLAKDNLSVKAKAGSDEYVRIYLTKKDMTYLIDKLTTMRDMMVDYEEGGE